MDKKINVVSIASYDNYHFKQIKLFNPKYVYLNDDSKILNFRSKLNCKTKILAKKELSDLNDSLKDSIKTFD